MKPGLLLLTAAFGCWGQQPAELTPAWSIRESLEALVKQTERLNPILDEVKPEGWIEKGAPDAYVSQITEVRDQIRYVRQNAEELSRRPDSMTGTLGVFLRLIALDSMLDSLSDGIRRYQNPALADLLLSVVSDNSANRARLRDYLVELAATKETELKIADEEAQRCRAQSIRQPRPGAPRQTKKQ
jgi:hypothetical protein